MHRMIISMTIEHICLFSGRHTEEADLDGKHHFLIALMFFTVCHNTGI